MKYKVGDSVEVLLPYYSFNVIGEILEVTAVNDNVIVANSIHDSKKNYWSYPKMHIKLCNYANSPLWKKLEGIK